MMAVTADDFKNFADPLANSDIEIDRRNYVSRSYYSVFHKVKPIADLLPPPLIDKSGGVHEKILQTLSSQPNSNAKALKLRSLYCFDGIGSC